MALDSYSDIKRYALSRADESTDGTSDFDTDAGDAILEAWQDLVHRWPWLSLSKDPPAAFVTAADITDLTLTILSTGTSVTGTLSAAPSGSISISGYKIRPSGENWLARITAHTADSTSITLDAVPETVAAGTACTIFKDEYDLASDIALFKNGLWKQDGGYVRLLSEETLRTGYELPPAGEAAYAFCRLTRRKIRLSHYPTGVYRYEYPYTMEPAAPSGTGALAIDAHLRPVLALGALAIVLEMKKDSRRAETESRYERRIEHAIAYEERLKLSLGADNFLAEAGAYR